MKYPTVNINLIKTGDDHIAMGDKQEKNWNDFISPRFQFSSKLNFFCGSLNFFAY